MLASYYIAMPSKADRALKQFNVYLPPELIRKLKHHAVDKDGTLRRMLVARIN